MVILSCYEIGLSFGTDVILNNVSFRLQQGEKTGLVGVNGAGKSTLFKIIIGELHQDSGEVVMSRGLRIGFLDQYSGLESDNTIWSEMLLTYKSLISIEKRLKQLESDISTEGNQDRLHSMMKEYDTLLERFSRDGGYEYNSRIRGVLRGLGFDDAQFELPIRTLSGGQKTRLALARLLLEEPDLLLLDEPTNHLDITAVEWLEDFLKSYKKSVFVISHDRYFLDTVATKTIELENNECVEYNGNYSEYAIRKSEARKIQQKHYELQQKEIARMEAFIEQQHRWNREKNIVAAESRQKAIDRMKKIQAPKKLPSSMKLKFTSYIKSGNDVLFIDELSKSYPGKELFKGISFEIKRNEKIFLLGPNGCGKSTLLKIISGKIPQTYGDFEFGHKIVLGYYDQELESLDENNTILEEVWNDNENLNHTQIRNVLAQFMFVGEDIYKTINILSGGEKSKVALVKLMLSGSNFLLLDEPTNHLDINSREVLEEALLSFDGTLLVVSHDRYFIRKLASRVIEMTNFGIEDYKGGYQYYLDYRRQPPLNKSDENGSKVSVSKREHLEVKEDRARRRKLEKQLKGCETEISRTETMQASISEEMSKDDALSDHMLLSTLHNEQLDLESHLEQLYQEWAQLSDELAELTQAD